MTLFDLSREHVYDDEIHLERSEHGDAAILRILGDIDLSTAHQLESALVCAAREAQRVILDLTHCTYIDSSVIRAIVHVNTALERRFKVVVAQAGNVVRILEICGITALLGTAPSLEAALL